MLRKLYIVLPAHDKFRFYFLTLCFFSVSCYVSSFMFYFVYLDPFSFPLDELGQRFIDFVYPFRKPTLDFTGLHFGTF